MDRERYMSAVLQEDEDAQNDDIVDMPKGNPFENCVSPSPGEFWRQNSRLENFGGKLKRKQL